MYRSIFFCLSGGDTIQLTKTKKELEKLGVKIDLSTELEPDLYKYDFIHLSNLTRIQETYIQAKNAVKQNKKFVLSTIYWPMEEFEKEGQRGLRKIVNSILSLNNLERVKAIVKIIKNKEERHKGNIAVIFRGYKAMQKYVVNNASLFLPNSYIEFEMMKKHICPIDDDKCIIVPNAIDKEFAKESLNAVSNDFEEFKDYIICVGRIEPRKNQLALVKALDNTNYKLLLVGQVSDNQKKYYEEIKPYLEKNNFVHIKKVDNYQLYNLFKVCKVSVLPSWLDTPGLVSLEAGAMGCNLVVSDRGSTEEYFKDHAEYCQPDDLRSIKKAIDSAYQKENDSELQKLIFEKYTWKEAGEVTYKAYKMIMNI